jgi:protoheme IX farnesyltransferase
VYAYTPLKRGTPLCTLIGAVPGALPVLAGWCATGRPVNTAALALTGVLFMWHSTLSGLGWRGRRDYQSASCPMLGVLDESGRASARVSLIYALQILSLFSLRGTQTRCFAMIEARELE